MSDVRRARYNVYYIIWQGCCVLRDGSRAQYMSRRARCCAARSLLITKSVPKTRTKVAALKPVGDRLPRPAAFLGFGLATWTRDGGRGDRKSPRLNSSH